MKIIKSFFTKKVLLIKPETHYDNRGEFSEIYNKYKFNEIGIKKIFIQDNYSFSKYKYTFRGLHLQTKPFSQAKLIRVNKGKIIDYVVDLRKNSKTYGNHVKIYLSENVNELIYIPEGFGHAFLTLKNNTIVTYKVSNKYSPEHSITINYRDKALNLDFKDLDRNKFILSKNDKLGITIKEFNKRK